MLLSQTLLGPEGDPSPSTSRAVLALHILAVTAQIPKASSLLGSLLRTQVASCVVPLPAPLPPHVESEFRRVGTRNLYVREVSQMILILPDWHLGATGGL